MTFLTVEDLKLSFNLFCVVYGVGTLGMPGNYARAGFVWGTAAVLLMAAINIYTTASISKVLLLAPKKVKTYGDLGEWCLGKPGRYVTVVTQLLVCWMVPIAFLVLSGTLLTTLFPGTYDDTTWIILMGLVLMPVCLMPSLKESAGVAAAGAAGTLIADVVALYVLVSNMSPIPAGLAPPPPVPTFASVTSVFGNLSLGYSAGVVIPALQREHTQPQRMPRVIVFTLGVCSVLFLIISITGVSTVGCQIPGNLLFAITGTKLGFEASRGGIVLAFLSMQLHCTVAFAVIVFPTFYIIERILFGFHQVSDDEAEKVDDFVTLESPKTDGVAESVAPTYNSSIDYLKAMVLRVFMVGITIVLAIVWKDQFMDILDFVGASSTAMTSMILPVLFTLKTFGKTLPVYERVWCIFVLVLCSALSVYISYTSGKSLFTPDTPNPAIKFPHCPAEFQEFVYTNRTHYNLP
ncbi:hypothetical protein H310_12331 [Aphanomyces invadans]|uniref:Amino acid transporter transmembrane domain-containing protein n=1 Tax=Aphanomyces invadans TaxID=157072 RepID=A0A024THX5_9STRA|nr:hypothetical protein H310_12331 [Aphanomyces invadans]ETV93765.1 hypothetical protein H310_12331 [Aphanomyces invadans]RHY21514.1 hypothetical protein DYB32_009797 [Aphanomyces invadans]|eukprot:XP_008877574.1 hypothetical protein H310_12331 [Aphanomyces invadans]